MDPLLVGGAVALGSGIISAVGQGKANRTNIKIAREQMGFQERMDNTKWQRTVADMERAGINPALAYSQGPRGAPSGAGTTVENDLGEGSSTALAAKTAYENWQLVKDQRKLVQQQTDKTNIEGRMTDFERMIKSMDYRERQARHGYYFNGDGTMRPRTAKLIEAEYGARIANNARSVADAEIRKFSIPEQKAIADLFENIGQGGKGAQIAIPVLLQLLKGRRN